MTSPSDPILLTDRTTIETDWKCGMARWWYKEHDGGGIVPVEEAVYFEEGRLLHHGLALIAQGEPIEAVLDAFPLPDTPDQLLLESAQRLRGWLAAYGTYIWPSIKERYEVLLVEHEVVLDRSPLWVASTPDLVLRERQPPHRIIIRDYKTVGMMGKSWMDYWPTAIQLHLLIKAVEEEINEPVAYAQIMGLMKGQFSRGRLNHPYVWAYSDETDQWEHEYQKARSKGLTNRPVWEYNAGILDWIERLGPDTAAAQFPFSRPVFLDERLLDQLIQSRINREGQVGVWRDECQSDPALRALIFEPRYSQCRPAIGSPCAYLAACHNATVNADPIGSGLYIPRTPHHDLELISGSND